MRNKIKQLREQLNKIENQYKVTDRDLVEMNQLLEEQIDYIMKEDIMISISDNSPDPNCWSYGKRIEAVAKTLNWKYWDKKSTISKADIIKTIRSLYDSCIKNCVEGRSKSYFNSGGFSIAVDFIEMTLDITFNILDSGMYMEDGKVCHI